MTGEIDDLRDEIWKLKKQMEEICDILAGRGDTLCAATEKTSAPYGFMAIACDVCGRRDNLTISGWSSCDDRIVNRGSVLCGKHKESKG